MFCGNWISPKASSVLVQPLKAFTILMCVCVYIYIWWAFNWEGNYMLFLNTVWAWIPFKGPPLISQDVSVPRNTFSNKQTQAPLYPPNISHSHTVFSDQGCISPPRLPSRGHLAIIWLALWRELSRVLEPGLWLEYAGREALTACSALGTLAVSANYTFRCVVGGIFCGTMKIYLRGLFNFFWCFGWYSGHSLYFAKATLHMLKMVRNI